MSWTVKGIYDGVPFTLSWADEPPGLVMSSEPPSDPLYIDLQALEGREFTVPPTGPTRQLDLTNPVSVLTAVAALGSVTSVEGDAPLVVTDVPAGAVA